MVRLAKLVDDGGGQILLIPEDLQFGCEDVVLRKKGDVVVVRPYKPRKRKVVERS